MKEDLPWFKHKKNARASGGAKALIAQYGYEGYGRFAALQEIISEQPGARLDLTLKKNRNGYAGELRMLPADFDAFLVFLADPQECGLIAYVDGVVTTPDTDKAYQSVERKRGVNRDDYESRQPKDNENGNSDNQKTDSDNRNDTEQSRAEQNRKKELAGLPPVDNFSEAELADLYACVLERAKKDPKVRKPAQWAKRVMLDPEWIEEWRARKADRAKGTAPPAPRIPCECGGELRFSGATAECRACGRFYHYDQDAQAWKPDESDGPEAAAVPPPGMCPACGRPLRVSREDPLRARCSCGKARVWNEITEAWVADLVPAGIDSS